MAEQRSLLLSNRVIGLIGMLLAVGIVSDGKLYNRTPKTIGIFPLTSPATISISQQDQLIMAFERRNEQWLMTQPTDALLNAERVQVLLDSNQQVSRHYTAADLPLADLFPDPVVLTIDRKQFQLGGLEPVSQLRYVLANDQVYLQADHVVPLIGAGATAFFDLSVTDSVSAVKINQHSLQNPESWTSLKALGIVPRDKLSSNPITEIAITQENNNSKVFELYVEEGVVILASPLQRYGYLISQQQSKQLGLAKYL